MKEYAKLNDDDGHSLGDHLKQEIHLMLLSQSPSYLQPLLAAVIVVWSRVIVVVASELEQLHLVAPFEARRSKSHLLWRPRVASSTSYDKKGKI